MIARSVLGSTRVPRSKLGGRLALLAVISLSLYALLGASSITFAAEKVTICHATSSESKPYVVNQPDASGDLSGHLADNGPIWYPGAKADKVVWGDIIPPIPGIIPDGLNWTDEGQAIYENDCNRLEPADPDIDVQKTADPTSLDFPGGSVTYTYVVTTDEGNVPLSDVTIDDDTCASITGPDGDTNDNDQLDVDEEWTYECTMEITKTTTNIVDVEGTYDEETVEDSDQETVEVGPEPDVPDIDVEKTADPASLSSGGGSVTYTYVVTNTGNLPLSNVTIDDDKCDAITGPVITGAGADDDDQLEVGEIWTYECTMDVTTTTTNVVVVVGTSGEDTVSGTDEATVTVGDVQPAVATPSPSLPSTSTIDEPGQGGGGAALVLLLILLGGGAAALVVLSPATIRIRK